MFPRITIISCLVFAYFSITAQITSEPALPVASQKITITFDSSKDSRLGYFTGDLYAHTGVIAQGNSNWQYVIGGWGNNSTQPKLTYKGNGIYSLEISPNVYSFYSVPVNEKIIQLAFVFRSSDSNKQTNDLFLSIFEEGLAVKINEPENNAIIPKNESFVFLATASVQSSLKLKINNTVIAENTGTQISANHIFSEGGYYWLIAEAAANSEIKSDSIRIFVSESVINQPKPSVYKKGVNYPSDNTAALVLWAPGKKNVFVLGDFNNWTLSNDFQMKKDGDYFWLEIQNLDPGKEYAFQYLIDGTIKIADPYTEKILDPWNDKYISSTVYPDLIDYPENKTEGVVSVLQSGQEEFSWEINDFKVPEKEKLVIYELLVRDFMTAHTYSAVREKLDYLEDLRINVLELMPVNEFEGNSSWGYNPSFYFAPDKYYGPKNELKKLIDECHKRGIAVVIDMVLNHSYGQSPFVQMYMDNWTILPENPWYNQESNFQNPDARWGYDFNHESAATRELVDSVLSFWMSEYKVDGFRFDFTKGFSNTPYPANSWGSNYDAPRIANLKRMTDEIRKRNENAIVIFEHLAENSEETELANYGILLWGNMHWSYEQAAKGNYGSSDLSWALYNRRGWNEPNLVSYPESHDEERIMYVIKKEGLSNGDYNIKNQTTALKRIELNSLFHIPLPGPKMIWQFGERGYDISINDFGGRLSEKPPYWQYLENPDRVNLFHVMAKLNELKQKYEEFTPESFETNLTGGVKWYKLKNGENHVISLGNFDIQERTANVTFPKTGKWYEFFTRDSIEVNSANQNISLAPGEYRMYSSRNFDDPHIITENREIPLQKGSIHFYPNPAVNEINITTNKEIEEILIYSGTGNLVMHLHSVHNSNVRLNTEKLTNGIYMVKVYQDGELCTGKFLITK